MNTLDELKADKLAAERQIQEILKELYDKYQCSMELRGGTGIERSFDRMYQTVKYETNITIEI